MGQHSKGVFWFVGIRLFDCVRVICGDRVPSGTVISRSEAIWEKQLAREEDGYTRQVRPAAADVGGRRPVATQQSQRGVSGDLGHRHRGLEEPRLAWSWLHPDCQRRTGHTTHSVIQLLRGTRRSGQTCGLGCIAEPARTQSRRQGRGRPPTTCGLFRRTSEGGQTMTQGFSAGVNDFCKEHDTKFALVKDRGQTGYLRVYDPYYTSFQPKQDGERYDLKLNEPFPELETICSEYPEDLFQLEQKPHRLVPFLVVLMRELGRWKQAHAGQIPTGFQQQQEFRAQLTASAEKLPDQENYTEALNNLSSVCKPRGFVPDEVQELLDLAEEVGQTRSEPFWKYLLALKQFIAKEGRTPVR